MVIHSIVQDDDILLVHHAYASQTRVDVSARRLHRLNDLTIGAVVE